MSLSSWFLSPRAPQLRDLFEGVAKVLLEEILVLGILFQVLTEFLPGGQSNVKIQTYKVHIYLISTKY